MSQNRKNKFRINKMLRLIPVTLGSLALFFIYFPIFWLMLLSFSAEPLTGIPGGWHFEWYVDMVYGADRREGEAFVGDFQLKEPLTKSIVIATLTSLLCMVSAVLVGRSLPKMKSQGLLLFGFLVPLMVPGIVVGIGMFLFFRIGLGIKMGTWSLALAHFVWAFPFCLLVILVVVSRLDQRILEAARDLGATKTQTFFQIELPIIKPGIFAAGFFGFLLSFNELPFSIFMRKGDMTLPIYLWIQSGAHNSSVPLIFALSTIITIISMLVTYLIVRVGFGKE
ncbi:MAG: ABC transporter permease [Paracoccaceae bacterium]|nr:ABC transporter permease [Paracoccaceae bacterium]